MLDPNSEPPAYLLRPMPTDLPSDPLGHEIALLLHEHPECSLRVIGGDIATMDEATKALLLSDIRRMLGIKPTKTRRWGYVGPEEND